MIVLEVRVLRVRGIARREGRVNNMYNRAKEEGKDDDKEEWRKKQLESD